MKAFVFPGQGSQYVGMGKELNAQSNLAGLLFRQANEVLGFDITSIMFAGTDEQLKETKVTQPAVFLDSVIAASCLDEDFKKSMMAGHSLGEFSALVVSGALAFEDGLKLVAARANAMQKACEQNPGTMAAIIGLEDAKVEEICEEVTKGGKVVVPANYNCPGQLVISGSIDGVNEACEKMKAAGAKRALVLNVGGAFHSPLMDPAKVELEAAINATEIWVVLSTLRSCSPPRTSWPRPLRTCTSLPRSARSSRMSMPRPTPTPRRSRPTWSPSSPVL